MYWHIEDIKGLQEQFNNLVEEAYGRTMGSMAPVRRSKSYERNHWMPPVEAWESERDIHLSMDLPGVQPEDMDVQVEGDQLIIKGERQSSAGDESKNYKRQEKTYGSFYRAFSLTTPVNKDKITASYKNGVLEVTIPKAEAVQPKQIKVSVEDGTEQKTIDAPVPQEKKNGSHKQA